MVKELTCKLFYVVMMVYIIFKATLCGRLTKNVKFLSDSDTYCFTQLISKEYRWQVEAIMLISLNATVCVLK